MVLHFVLGVIFGSVINGLAGHDDALPSWICNIKNWKEYFSEKADIKHIVGILLTGIGFATISFTRAQGLDLAVLYVAVATIGFSAIYDLHYCAIYPISHAITLTALLKVFSPNEIWMIVWAYIAFYIIGKCMKDKIGEGDLDIAFLMLVCSGFKVLFQSVFIASALGLLVIIPQILIDRKHKLSRIPFVPFLYAGFIITLVLESLLVCH